MITYKEARDLLTVRIWIGQSRQIKFSSLTGRTIGRMKLEWVFALQRALMNLLVRFIDASRDEKLRAVMKRVANRIHKLLEKQKKNKTRT